MVVAIEAAELAEHRARFRMVAVHDEPGLAAMLLGLHQRDLDRALDVGFERVALDAREQLAEERGVDPLGLVVPRAGAVYEVEEVHDRRALRARVADQRMAVIEPAHRDVTAVAADLLRCDGAALLGDVEQRLQEYSALGLALGDAAGLVGARERIEDGLDRRDAAGVLARHRVDPPQHPNEGGERLRHERVVALHREELLCPEARWALAACRAWASSL